ncbi:MAG: DNA-protecting protein DprA [Parcubacteria group bacterium]|nr:DNA-protecting protein DprA [Parcubacteria group bacterium]
MEAKFYNAANVAKRGEYGALAKLKSGDVSWREIWEREFSGEKTADPEKEWQRMEKEGIRLLLRDDADFPASLREAPFPPFGIYVLGEIPALAPFVAVVGTRKATSYGREAARKIAGELSAAGVVIVSGLAMGIDTAAHEGALGGGRTIAVLANGLDRVYPAQNANLAKKILAGGGALISEYPIGSESLPRRFLERNRIISGLSLGVVVVEAPARSGALNTARFALDQNREVFAVPGPVSHSNYVGSHQLLKSGAALATEAADILDALNIEAENPALEKAVQEADGEEGVVLREIQNASFAVGIDKISENTKLQPQAVSRAVTFLALKGLIKEIGGGYTVK